MAKGTPFGLRGPHAGSSAKPLQSPVNLFNPQVVVIGGQLAAAEDYYFAGIREAVYRRSLPLATRRIEIVGAARGNQAGLIGMALLVAQTIFTRYPRSHV